MADVQLRKLKMATESAETAIRAADGNRNVDHLIARVAIAIDIASASGHRRTNAPSFKGVRTPVSAEQERAVYAALVSAGYGVTHYDSNVVITW